MATFNKFNAFTEQLAKAVHNLATHQFVLALSAVAPVAGNSVLADLTQIAYTNLSSRNLTVTSAVQAGGVLKWVVQDLVLTASGGSVTTFRYVTIYNDTATSPADALVGWYDYGSNVTLLDGESFTVDFDAANGVLTLA
jgi:hypothetical protein